MEPPSPTADELRRGDQAAVARIATQFHGRLYRFFRCNGLDVNSAEEMTAETLSRLIEAFQRFRGDDSQVRSFAYSIARNVQSRYWRQSSRNDVSLEMAADAVDPCGLPADSLLLQEKVQHLMSAMQQLPETVREIVTLRYVEELSMVEIAAAMEMPEGTVKSHLHRGKQQLKTILAPVEEGR